MLARYNRRANQLLYAACASLEDGARKQDRGAFFRSIHGTLNHLLIGDRIWMARFEGGQAPSTGLDAIVHEDFAELRAARATMDLRIEHFMDAMTADFASGNIAYVNNQGLLYTDSIAMLLAHFFNHQTHHRAQIQTLLSQAGIAPPILDLHRVIKPVP